MMVGTCVSRAHGARALVPMLLFGARLIACLVTRGEAHSLIQGQGPRTAFPTRLRGGGRVHKSGNKLEGEEGEPALRGSVLPHPGGASRQAAAGEADAANGQDAQDNAHEAAGVGQAETQRLGFSRTDGLGILDDDSDLRLGIRADSDDGEFGGALGDGGIHSVESPVGGVGTGGEGGPGPGVKSAGMRVIGLEEEQKLEFLRRISGMLLHELATQNIC